MSDTSIELILPPVLISAPDVLAASVEATAAATWSYMACSTAGDEFCATAEIELVIC